MPVSKSSIGQSPGRPLCRRYLAVRFAVQAIRGDERCGRGRAVRFACAVSADGHLDVFGIEPSQPHATLDWWEVSQNLRDRGVQTIKYVGVRDEAGIHADLLGAFPEALALPPVDNFADRTASLRALPPRYRRLLVSIDEIVSLVKCRMRRALVRASRIQNEAQANASISETLDQVARGLANLSPGSGARGIARDLNRSSSVLRT